MQYVVPQHQPVEGAGRVIVVGKKAPTTFHSGCSIQRFIPGIEVCSIEVEFWSRNTKSCDTMPKQRTGDKEIRGYEFRQTFYQAQKLRATRVATPPVPGATTIDRLLPRGYTEGMHVLLSILGEYPRSSKLFDA